MNLLHEVDLLPAHPFQAAPSAQPARPGDDALEVPTFFLAEDDEEFEDDEFFDDEDDVEDEDEDDEFLDDEDDDFFDDEDEEDLDDVEDEDDEL